MKKPVLCSKARRAKVRTNKILCNFRDYPIWLQHITTLISVENILKLIVGKKQNR